MDTISEDQEIYALSISIVQYTKVRLVFTTIQINQIRGFIIIIRVVVVIIIRRIIEINNMFEVKTGTTKSPVAFVFEKPLPSLDPQLTLPINTFPAISPSQPNVTGKCNLQLFCTDVSVRSEGNIIAKDEVGKASRTHIASIPQFTHKNRLAATCSPLRIFSPPIYLPSKCLAIFS